MRITLERLKQKTGLTWLNNPKRLERPVRIISEGLYWRKDRAGYTGCKEAAGVACKSTDREFIGIEKERKYFDIATQRIVESSRQLRMSL